MLPVELSRRSPSGWRAWWGGPGADNDVDLVAAAVRHPSWAVAGLGSVVEPEEEAGAGL